ncbi:hypothetical protein D1872_208940 [compost metagenome]
MLHRFLQISYTHIEQLPWKCIIVPFVHNASHFAGRCHRLYFQPFANMGLKVLNILEADRTPKSGYRGYAKSKSIPDFLFGGEQYGLQIFLDIVGNLILSWR